jgi:MFS superfamily sulfate permease-like transporter
LAARRRKWLARDVVDGIVLSTLLVPRGTAYAELAGLPSITGLHTSILCLLGYAVFGPSRILVLARFLAGSGSTVIMVSKVATCRSGGSSPGSPQDCLRGPGMSSSFSG